MKISPAGVNLIKEFEGFSARPYQDSVGVWTIGYGHTEGVGPHSPHLTEGAASRLLAADLNKKYAPYVDALAISFNQHQFDALVSFVYNVGPGGIAKGTKVGDALRAHEFSTAADKLLAWNKAGGRVLPGLDRRRHEERALFLKATNVMDGYLPEEIKVIREYDRLLRAKKDVARRKELQASMTDLRKNIWRAAQGEGGWEKNHRAQRYRSLQART